MTTSARSRVTQLRLQIGSAILARLSPERTRRATLFERMTVRRLSWDLCVKCNRWLSLVGKITTGIWVAFLVSLVLGVNWRVVVEEALNSGKPVTGAIVLVVVLPTFAFLLARSMIGFLRWRVQRELWRRDVERLGTGE